MLVLKTTNLLLKKKQNLSYPQNTQFFLEKKYNLFCLLCNKTSHNGKRKSKRILSKNKISKKTHIEFWNGSAPLMKIMYYFHKVYSILKTFRRSTWKRALFFLILFFLFQVKIFETKQIPLLSKSIEKHFKLKIWLREKYLLKQCWCSKQQIYSLKKKKLKLSPKYTIVFGKKI